MLIIDNDRVSVWDARLSTGDRGPETPNDVDKIIMFIDGGDFEMATPLGAIIRLPTQPGQAMFIPKGAHHPVLASGSQVQVAIVALKDAPGPSNPNSKTPASASPYPGSTRMIATPRATVWRHAWQPDTPTPTRFHDKDIVVAYRHDGSLKCVSQDGAASVTEYKKGDIRFYRGGRPHAAVLTTERQSVLMVELG
jgi:hypothetical protein